MIKKLLLILLAFVAGILSGLYMLGVPLISTFTAMIQSVTQPIQAMVQSLLQNITQNPIPTLTGIGIGAAPIILIASKAYTAVKTRLSAKVQQVTDQKNLAELEANRKISGLQTEKEKLEAQVQTFQNQTGEGATALTTRLSEAQTQLTRKEEEIKRLTTRVNEAERLANVVMHPTEADLIKRLEQTGHTVTKTVL